MPSPAGLEVSSCPVQPSFRKKYVIFVSPSCRQDQRVRPMLRPRIAWRDTGCLFRRSGRRRGEGPGRNGPVLWGPARNRTPGRALQGPVGLSTRQVSHPLDAKLRVGRPMASSLVAPQSGTFCLHIEMRRTKRKRTERWQRLAANRATPPHFQPISPLRTRRLFPYRIRSTIVNTHETPFRGDFAAGCYGIGRRSFRHAKHSRLSHLWPRRRIFWHAGPRPCSPTGTNGTEQPLIDRI